MSYDYYGNKFPILLHIARWWNKLTEDNNKQYNPKDPGHRDGGGPGHEKRSNEPASKEYRNRTHEHERFTEQEKESLFGKGYKK